MALESLGDFLSLLQDAGEVQRISATVDSALEIAEITRRICRQPGGGPALFFESVRGSAIPVVTNLLGSERRLCRALGADSLKELEQRLRQAPRAEAGNWLDAFRLSSLGQQLSSLAPRILKQAYCQQIVKLGRDVNLWELPALRAWPDEHWPVMTLGQVVTRCPVTQRRHLELIPVQVVDQQQLVPCWHPRHRAWQAWQSGGANQQMPIAIALGGHPCLPLAGMANLPDDVEAIGFAGLLQGGPVEMVRCRTHDLEVPAQAEIIVEGMIDPAASLKAPSPFALSTGFYAARRESLPVIQVTGMTHRANPIFPAQIIGSPPGEEDWLRQALERLLLPWIQASIPELCDWSMPVFGAGRNWLFVSIRKSQPFDAQRILHALLGHPLTSRFKGIVLVDQRVNVRSTDDIWFTVGAQLDPSRDLVVLRGPIDGDDPAGSEHKFGIDATRKLPGERQTGVAPRELTMPMNLEQQVSERWAELGLSAWGETLR